MFGNHEFHLGTDHLKEALKRHGSFPMLATNIDFDDPDLAGLVKKDLILTTADGVKVGFFSLVPPRLVTQTRGGSGVRIEPDLARAARESIRRLRDQGAEVTVLLSHASLEEDLALAGELEGLSLLVTGSDRYDPEPALHWVRGPGGRTTAVAVGGAMGRSVTAFTLTFQRGRPRPGSEAAETVVVSRNLAPDLKMAEIVERYDRQLDDLLNEPIAAFDAPVDAHKRMVRAGESGLGEFLADGFRWRTGSRLAVLNAGGIRGDRLFPAGPISIRTVLEILPFSNHLVVKEMTGQEVRLLLELSASALVGPGDRYVSEERMNSGGLLHFSGLRATVALGSGDPPALVGEDGRITDPGGRLKEVLVLRGERWVPLDDAETYTVTMPDFLAAGGDRFTFLAGLPGQDTQVVDSDAVIDYLRSLPGMPRLRLEADGRLRIEGGK
jgi:5'-nucleotidase